MANFYLSNSDYKKAKVVILGVPDESGSRSNRKKGVSEGPDYIRKVSNEKQVFKWHSERPRKVQSQNKIINQKVCDIGNITKKDLSNKISFILKDKKIPITFGGDHSITSEVLKGIDKTMKNISVIYFDAHPDFRCSAGHYYGSVMCEICKMKNVNMKKSAIIGMRAPEKEEIKNLKKSKMLVLTPFDIESTGIKKVLAKIKSKVGKNNIYMSIDIDVLDSAYAPGVDTPVPAGLTASQLIFLVKNIAKLGLVGFDLVEINPKYDVQKRTGHLASMIISEIVSEI